jgi:hypothetical protein
MLGNCPISAKEISLGADFMDIGQHILVLSI